MDTLRLLLMSPQYGATGGWGRYTREFARELGKSHEVTLLVPKDSPDLKESEGFLPLLHKPRMGNRDFINILRDKRLVKKSDFDLAVSCAAYYTNRLNPDAIVCHGTYALHTPYFLGDFLQKRAYKSARKVISISDYTREQILQKYGTDSTVVPLAVDFKKFNVKKTKHEGFNLISVCRLVRRKGIDICLRAVKKASERITINKYYIVGDGPKMLELKDLAKELGLENIVEFVGNISLDESEKLMHYYSISDLYIMHPLLIDGHYEGFGLVFLEAASAGLPIVASSSGGVPTAVKEGKNGLLVAEQDVDAMADAIVKLASDVKMRETFSSFSVSWARSHNWGSYVKSFFEAME